MSQANAVQKKPAFKTIDMAYIAIGAVLITVCSWISIPTTVPFTLQTFAVFLVVYLLGGKRGTLSVVIYILLGAVGVPVFSQFTGGLGILLGKTGGYIIGFVLSALIMWAFEPVSKHLIKNKYVKIAITVLSMLIGLLACYTLGTVWFRQVYLSVDPEIALATILGWCVFPFIVPDLVKIALATALGITLKRVLPIDKQ